MDLDGVLADFAGAVVEFWLREGILGPEWIHAECRWLTWYPWECMPVSEADFALALACPEVWRKTPCYPGADGTARVLAAHADVHIVTSRTLDQHAEAWIRDHQIPCAALAHVPLAEKPGYAREQGLQAFFEDNREAALGLAAVVPKVYLVERPWNALATDPASPNLSRFSFDQGAREWLDSMRQVHGVK